MSIVKQALAEAQEALMAARHEQANHDQAVALAEQLTGAYAGRGLCPRAKAWNRKVSAELDFKVNTIDLLVVMFEAAARGENVVLNLGGVGAFAAKLLEVQAARQQVIAHTH